MKDKDLIWSILAIAVYILGGVATFTGAGLILLMKGQDLWGWGEGHTIGYLLVCIGLIFSVLGVLVMRILRNRI
ncbi:MAG: hypothetical protein GXP51_04565 [Deltaproteobacteria bacterium]|nr:hypothetical protein [Deltaproteobacteria bacterium]